MKREARWTPVKRRAIRWTAGAALAAAVIGLWTLCYPATAGPSILSVLAWMMAIVVGLYVALPPTDPAEDWARGWNRRARARTAIEPSVILPAKPEPPVRYSIRARRDRASDRVHGHARAVALVRHFAEENPVCFLATVEERQPRVRTVLLWFVHQSGFYFVLVTPKPLSEQLDANPRAEICFLHHPRDLGQSVQMRVSGRMERVRDRAICARAAKERAFWSRLSRASIEDHLEVFRLKGAQARFWTMDDVLQEAHLDAISLKG